MISDNKTLSLTDFSLSTQGHVLIQSLSLEIRPHEVCHIIGAANSGKSQLARYICGINPLCQATGIVDITPNHLLVPQHAQQSLNPSLNAIQHCKDIKPVLSDQEIGDYLLSFNFPTQHNTTKCCFLSTGQAQTLAIAISLLASPSLLVIDEPFFALDASQQSTITKHLHIAQRQGMSILILSSHPLPDIPVTSLTHLTPWKTTSPPQKKRPKHTSHPLLSFDNVAIANPHRILHPCNLSIFPKQILGLTGKNGTGKSTIAHAIMQSVPFLGTMYLNNTPIQKHTLYQSRAIQLMFQQTQQSFHPEKPLGSILHEPNINIVTFHEITRAFNLHNWQNLYPHQAALSTLKSLAFARIMSRNPQMVILDEPFAAMTHSWIHVLANLLLSYHVAAIIIDHNTQYLTANCHSVLNLEQGVLHALS